MPRIAHHVLLAGALLASAFTTHAATVNGNYVGLARPYFYGDNLYIDGALLTKTGGPACATRNILNLAIDANSANFKSEYAMLLAMWVAGKPVNIVGTGTCTGEGDETILQVWPTQ